MSASWKKAQFEKLAPYEVVALVVNPALMAQAIGYPIEVRHEGQSIVIEISGWTTDGDGVYHQQPLVVNAGAA